MGYTRNWIDKRRKRIAGIVGSSHLKGCNSLNSTQYHLEIECLRLYATAVVKFYSFDLKERLDQGRKEHDTQNQVR